MAFKNLHPFTDQGVLGWLQQIDTGRSCTDLAATFKCSAPEMRLTIDRLQEKELVGSEKQKGHRLFFSQAVEAPVLLGEVVAARAMNMFSAPMTKQSAQRMGTFWSIDGAMKR
jgi:hypothetical protein